MIGENWPEMVNDSTKFDSLEKRIFVVPIHDFIELFNDIINLSIRNNKNFRFPKESNLVESLTISGQYSRIISFHPKKPF